MSASTILRGPQDGSRSQGCSKAQVTNLLELYNPLRREISAQLRWDLRAA
jgi:hypothetical protein